MSIPTPSSASTPVPLSGSSSTSSLPIDQGAQKAQRAQKPSITPFPLAPTSIGSASHFTPIAGPCAVESYEQLEKVAKVLKKNKVHLLRGGLWKLRTRHESFQGVGKEGLEWVRSICRTYQLGFITEITDLRQLELLEGIVSAFQVGTRNMYNYPLLKELGKTRKPVLLKRHFSATIEEWLQAAEYIVQGGNEQVILCERGIRTFENSTRYTLDINAVVYLKHRCPFPVVVDPSHAIGIRELIPSLCYASIAAEADGLLVEVHPQPEEAKSDAAQALSLSIFQETLSQMEAYLLVAKRTFSPFCKTHSVPMERGDGVKGRGEREMKERDVPEVTEAGVFHKEKEVSSPQVRSMRSARSVPSRTSVLPEVHSSKKRENLFPDSSSLETKDSC